MEDKNLDKIIGEKLKDLDIPYQATSWDALEGRLNAVDATKQFDESMRRKLSDIEMSYQPMYWDLLASRLEQEAIFRNQVIRYKATEVLLVFLILITFVQFFPPQTSKFAISDVVEGTLETSQASKPGKITSLNDQHSDIDDAISIFEVPDESNEIISSSNLQDRIVSYSYNQEVAVIGSKILEPLSHSERVISSLFEQLKTQNLTTEEEYQYFSSPNIEPSELALLEEKAWTEPNLIPSPYKVKKRFRVGMFVSANTDYVETPYDEIFQLDPYGQLAINYGGGVLVSWEWKKLEFETGVIYSHKKYEPAQKQHIWYGNINDGYKVEALEDIELNTIQIPVQLRYDAITKEKWQLYVMGGASVHVAAQANYDVSSIEARAINISSTRGISELSEHQKNRFDKIAKPSKPESDKLNQKKFSNGWLSGGSFSENSYYTANIGFGVERFLDERLSVFVQPTYRQHLTFLNKGIGPNQDQISTFQLILGAKVGF